MRPADAAEVLQVAAREANEIIYSAPLPRLRDDDGTEYVARDALAAEVRQHFLRRIDLLSRRATG